MAFTYFFRDLQTLELICEHALPYLQSRKFINIWDAGCAMGPEPYTLAILIREKMSHMYFRNVRIHATDIDGSNLFREIIENGLYPREEVERVPENLFQKYFTYDSATDKYRLIEEIRKSVTFYKHDLTSLVPVGEEYGIILCKNVLLHFSESQRIDVIKMFHDSLVSEGYLATEHTQKLPLEVKDLFVPVVSNAQLFRKVKADR